MIYTDCIIGETMCYYRRKFDYTLDKIAKGLGISQPTLSRVEMGTSSVKLYLVLAFCELVNISMEDFLKYMKSIPLKKVAA